MNDRLLPKGMYSGHVTSKF